MRAGALIWLLCVRTRARVARRCVRCRSVQRRVSHVVAANARTASTSPFSTLMPAVKRRTPEVANVNGGTAAPEPTPLALRPPDAAAAALLPPASASVPRPARSASLRRGEEAAAQRAGRA
jgi:hypothetical protein